MSVSEPSGYSHNLDPASAMPPAISLRSALLLLLWLVTTLQGSSVSAEPLSTDFMTLHRRLTHERPSWQHSLANFSAGSSCTCLRRCLIDESCLSVLLYPEQTTATTAELTGNTTEATGNTTELPGNTTGTAGNTTETSTEPPVTATPPATSASTAGSLANILNIAAAAIAAAGAATDGPVVCQLYTTSHDEDASWWRPRPPTGAKFCSRQGVKKGLLSLILSGGC